MFHVSPCLKRFLAVAVIGLIILSPTTLFAFTDTAGHWAHPTFDHLSSRELISGYPDGSFLPDAPVNRAELAVLLVHVLNKEEEARQLEKGAVFFADCHDHWARGYIEVARELDIVRGDGFGLFAPLRPVSRQEAALMMAGALGLPHMEAQPQFADTGEVAPWAQSWVAAMQRNGLLTGFPDGTFKPLQVMTRAEVAVLLEKMLAYKGQLHHFYGELCSIDLRARQAVVRVDGQETVFELGSRLIAYSEGGNQPLQQLAVPIKGYFDLDSESRMVFFLASSTPPASRVNFTFSTLPSGLNLEASKAMVQFSQEDSLPTKATIYDDPALSMDITREVMGIGDFEKNTGASGRGQLVAVIDSGVDPGHPDLKVSGSAFRKMVDYIDLSDEGLVKLQEIRPENGYLQIEGKQVRVDGIANQADLFYWGKLDVSFLPSSFTTARKPLLVVLAAGEALDKFDTVYVDTNGDGDIRDEKAVRRYSKSFQVLSLSSDGEATFNMVLSEIDPAGRFVKFGFDALGHGTEMAGIVAARGKVEGMAPDAQLLVIKVLNRMGTAPFSRVESALAYAADHGAKIAVLSMGKYQLNDRERQTMAQLAENIWKSHKMLLCIAAGNNGPGLQSVADTAGMPGIISVGAYTAPEMWERDYGWLIDAPILCQFSSVGPGFDGSLTPMAVAPGSVISTYPLWTGEAYHRDEGTSIAAAHVAGALALLMDASLHKLYREDIIAVGQALLAGAEPLAGYQPVEQGFGAINVSNAWKEITQSKGASAVLNAKQLGPGYGWGSGYYSPFVAPAQSSLKIVNQGNESETLALGGLTPWIKPQQYTVQIPAQGERRVSISFAELTDPGLYSGLLVGDDYRTPGFELSVLQAVVVPNQLARVNGKVFEDEDRLPAGRYKRYYFAVPEGIKEMNLHLETGEKGIARMYVISPLGDYQKSEFVGVGDGDFHPDTSLALSRPAAGTWEVVVYSSATLNAHNLHHSEYRLWLDLQKDEHFQERLRQDAPFLVAAVPCGDPQGESQHLTLFFWNRNSKQPAEGLVSINGRMYEIFRGKVELEARAENGLINLDIAW